MPIVDGFRYLVFHERNMADDEVTVLPLGGRTRVELLDPDYPDTEAIAIGEAVCHPRDNYNRKLGVTIALGRALKNLRLTEK